MTSDEQSEDQGLSSSVSPGGEILTEISEAQALLRPFSTLAVNISIELGRSTLKISDLLDLGYHSVVELDKPAGDNLDIFVNSILLGRGEVVVIEDKVGIKINELADHTS